MVRPLAACAIILTFSVTLAIVGCGVKSPPRGPEYIPMQPITDLEAFVSASRITLSWTPKLEYVDGAKVDLKSVEIYRLSQDLADEYRELQEGDEERIEEIRRNDGTVPIRLQDNTALGPIGQRIRQLNRIRIENFLDDAELIATIPTEQLVSRVVRGRLVWTSEHDLQMAAEPPMSRHVFAVRQVDDKGDVSPLSNRLTVYPVYGAERPENLVGTVQQQETLIAWQGPEGLSALSREIPLAGYNIYRMADGADPILYPVNDEPVQPAAPVEWLIENASGYRGTSEGFMLVSTGEEKAGVSQMFYEAGEIKNHAGETITITATVKTLGESSPLYCVVDFSRRFEGFTASKPANADIFSENENPLIHTREIDAGDSFQTVQFSVDVPVDAVSAQVRLEIRHQFSQPVVAFVQSISARNNETDEELLANSGFDSFETLEYRQSIESFGGDIRYQVTSLYKLGDYFVESSPSEAVELSLVDTFAPPAPANVVALASRQAISLTWNAVAAEDLAGYNVYRRNLPRGTWVALNKTPLKETIFRDQEMEAGKDYAYRVEAVDTRGNESSTEEIVEISALTAN